jgi:DNA-binding IclR family transcriptional regulator
VNLAVLSGPEVIFVERLQSPYIIEPSLRVGSHLSIHYSSLGKAILAYLPESELDDIVNQIRFERRTDRTITSARAFKNELRGIREKGFALNDEELEKGLFAISAPLRNYTGMATAAMNIAFPLMRHSKEKAMKTFLPLLLETCGKISSILGFREM